MSEIAEEVNLATQQADAPEAPASIANIYEGAIADNKTNPEDGQTGKEQVTEQAVTPPFLELLVEEGKKVAFKTEDEFNKFLDSNKVLKEGWLRQSDYTRKTQEIAQQKKEFESRIQEEQKLWGKNVPDAQSKTALATLWNVFQTTQDPVVSDSILKFVQDVNLIANGKDPVGPLKQDAPANTNPEILDLKKQVMSLTQQLRGFHSQMTEKQKLDQELQQAIEQERSEKMVADWEAEKKKQGISVTPEEYGVMESLYREDGQGNPVFTLDQLHKMALAHLGKSTAEIAKKVIVDAKKQNEKSPRTPVSRTSSSHEPEAKGIGDIYNQGLKNLAS